MCVGAPEPCWETVCRSQCDAAVTQRCSAGSQVYLFHGLYRNSAVSAVIQSHQDTFLPTYSWNIISRTLPFHLLRPPQNQKPFKNPFKLLAECYAFWLHSLFFNQIKVQSIKVRSAFRRILFLSAMKVEQMLKIIWPKGSPKMFKAKTDHSRKKYFTNPNFVDSSLFLTVAYFVINFCAYYEQLHHSMWVQLVL